jgi:hypothetical protein
VDARLDEDETEFGVFVFAVAFEVFADCYCLQFRVSAGLRTRVRAGGCGWWDGKMGEGEEEWRTYLLDEHVEVLWDFGGEALMGSLCQYLCL